MSQQVNKFFREEFTSRAVWQGIRIVRQFLPQRFRFSSASNLKSPRFLGGSGYLLASRADPVVKGGLRRMLQRSFGRVESRLKVRQSVFNLQV